MNSSDVKTDIVGSQGRQQGDSIHEASKGGKIICFHFTEKIFDTVTENDWPMSGYEESFVIQSERGKVNCVTQIS